MYWYLDDILTWGLIILSFVIVLIAQIMIKVNYGKYKKISNNREISGSEVARMILDKNGLSNVYVVETTGELTDHYDPRRKVVKLSTDIYRGNSIAAISVAAHEVGHAIQDKVGYTFMRVRSMLVPFVNLVSYAGYFGIIVSVFAGVTGYLKLCLFIEVATLIFQLVTLPVEFNASSRAKKELLDLNIIDTKEHKGVSKMLRAAAMTYVASLISVILNILRIVILINRRDD